MKSDEDILLAREYIEEGGDYRRAIEIYETALAADPDNARLKQELEATKARRYMTAARFGQVKEGMTQDEVRRLLGSPNLQDVRVYPDRGVTAWFYPKDASGAAAAVWFQKKAAAAGMIAEVYLLDFDAIQPPAPDPSATP
jgi:tetratricopeptide (TPR) repeat protein